MTSGSHLDLPRSDGVRRPPSRLYRTLRPVARRVFDHRWDVHVTGAEHVPRTGPVVVACNHIGLMDGPLLAAYNPRPIHVLTKREMFVGHMGRGLRLVGQIPVTRYEPDPRAVKTALRVLRDDGVIGLFPEGTRGDGELRGSQGGAAYFALVTGAPVVPCVFLGTREPGGGVDSVPARGARFDVVYGEPVYLTRTPWPRTQPERRAAAEKLRQTMRAHLDQALARTGQALPGPMPGLTEDDIEDLRQVTSRGNNDD